MAEINVTPFVDVMLVLLIVFMVTAPLLTAGVEVALPKTDASVLPSAKDPLTITILQNGDIYLQETKASLDELTPRMAAIAAAGYEERVYIRAAAHADYETVMRVMARVSGAGFTNLALVSDPLAK
ncbi:MAG: ExbD/TolR family protein [Caulobacterales bacterium]